MSHDHTIRSPFSEQMCTRVTILVANSSGYKILNFKTSDRAWTNKGTRKMSNVIVVSSAIVDVSQLYQRM